MRYRRVYIQAIGYELAPIVVTSEELEERLAPVYKALHIAPGQLEAITGIVERRYWEPGFSVAMGAALAAKRALKQCDISPEFIEARIYAGVCREQLEPATACDVAAHLQQQGIKLNPAAQIYDHGNACLGVLGGMIDIANRIELGQIRAGLVVSCESARDIVETMTRRMLATPTMDLFKYSVATLTGGSGAVAVLLTDGSFASQSKHQLLGGVHQSAPEHHRLCRWGFSPDPSSTTDSYQQSMATDSVAVMEHGTHLGFKTWQAFLQHMDWRLDEVDRTVCHQVGASHRQGILNKFGLQPECDFVTYDFLGNTGTVALPLAAAIASERQFLQNGQRVAFLGIGSGLNCTMLGLRW